MEHEHTTTEPGNGTSETSRTRLWDRPVEDRLIGGVAAGIAHRMRVAPWLIRAFFIIGTFAEGAGLLAYFVLWLLMPDRATGRSILDGADVRIPSIDTPAKVIGVVLIAVGGAVLLGATSFFSTPIVLAIALAGAGLALIASRS